MKQLKASIPEINEQHHAEKLNEFGAAPPNPYWSKEDERGAALALRAQEGDYDEGKRWLRSISGGRRVYANIVFLM